MKLIFTEGGGAHGNFWFPLLCRALNWSPEALRGCLSEAEPETVLTHTEATVLKVTADSNSGQVENIAICLVEGWTVTVAVGEESQNTEGS